ncbi:MAG: hypothetical protein H7X94_09745 [Vallitaleaceae bacterium]|nr:hypothetical protein [Vallitaleaceae bacterium]
MIKVDVITGFLGAGKTTLIRNMLESGLFESKKTVVIVNEFGKVGIDGTLMNYDGLEVYEIANGCICCSSKENFSQTLHQISTTLTPEQILIEPSGIFMIEDLLHLMKEPVLMSLCQIHAIITVIDAQRFMSQQKVYNQFFKSQLSYATALWINKVSQLSEGDLALLEVDLNHFNSKVQSVVNHGDLFSVQDMTMLLAETRIGGVDNEHQHGHHHHLKHTAFENYGFYSEQLFTKDQLLELGSALRSGDFGKVIRGKGLFKTLDCTLEFQYVDGDLTLTPFKGPAIEHKMSIIGEGLQTDKIDRYFSQ